MKLKLSKVKYFFVLVNIQTCQNTSLWTEWKNVVFANPVYITLHSMEKLFANETKTEQIYIIFSHKYTKYVK